MKSLHLALLATAAVSAAGCTRPADPTRRTALDCPQVQGALTRTGVSADGRTCTYSSSRGDQIALRLLPVTSTPEAALRPVEAELQTLVPAAPTVQKVAKSGKSAEDEDDDADEESTDDTGDHAQVDLPGIHVDAQGDKANVNIGSLHINAGGAGAVVHETHNVRLRGEALALQRRGYRAVYIVARSDLPGGLASVGYEAGGPRKGPLAVAVVRMKTEGDDIYKDVRRLLRRNAGI
jgi:hypothetical protein